MYVCTYCGENWTLPTKYHRLILAAAAAGPIMQSGKSALELFAYREQVIKFDMTEHVRFISLSLLNRLF